MPALSNVRWEQFCQLLASGTSRTDSYLQVFATTNRRTCAKRGSALAGKPEVASRVTEIEDELRAGALERAGVDREFVIKGLKENISKSSQTTPILNRQGQPTGKFKYEPTAVNRGYELIGKELGMFKDAFTFEGLDNELQGMDGDQLRTFLRGIVGEVGMRVVQMNKEELRTYILRECSRAGLMAIGLLDDEKRDWILENAASVGLRVSLLDEPDEARTPTQH